LERLRIEDPSFLTTPFCKHLTSLQCLELQDVCEDIEVAGLTCEQEAALQLLKSLQQLRFDGYELSDLPVGLHSLPSLKRLEIFGCPSISRLPERGLPPSLEELEVYKCSEELTKQCRTLATSKLKVIIFFFENVRARISLSRKRVWYYTLLLVNRRLPKHKTTP
jgi:hypothetical protein